MMRTTLLAAAVIASGTLANAGTYGGPYDDPTVGNFNPGGSIHDYGGTGSINFEDTQSPGCHHSLLCLILKVIGNRKPPVVAQPPVIPPVVPPFEEPETPVVTPPVEQPAQVPLPAGLPLLAVALGGLAMMRRVR